MSDTTPMVNLIAVSAGDSANTALTQTATGCVTGRSAGTDGLNEGSFLDFLNAFNALSGPGNSPLETQAEGGSSLPQVAVAAETGRLPLLDSITALQPLAPLDMAETAPSEAVSTARLNTENVDVLPEEPGFSAQLTSAALASRLVGLAPAHLTAGKAEPTTPAVSASTDPVLQQPTLQQPALQQTGPAVSQVQLGAQQQLSAQVYSATLTSFDSKTTLTRVGVTALSRPDSITAGRAGSTDPLALVARTSEMELPEAGILSATQLTKALAEQQLSNIPQTAVTTNLATADPLTAAYMRLGSASTMLTTDITGTQSTHQATLTEAFGKPDWNQAMSRQMLLMVNQNIRSAELRLNPAHLGPIEVRIEMEDDQVNLAFSSRHAVVREAVELALPRLREMFEENGLNLAETDISHQSFAEQRSQQAADFSNQRSAGAVSTVDGVNPEDDAAESVQTRQPGTRLVDYYI